MNHDYYSSGPAAHILIQRRSGAILSQGQLVLPVCFDEGAGNKLAGVIEYVTTVRKESYIEDFEEIHNLLKDKGLKSTYVGKTIKVVYNGHMIKFRLPLSSKFIDLLSEVTKRFADLEHKKLCVKYEDNKGNILPISSDEVLWGCMEEASSKGANFIKMHVSLEHVGC
ncbi:hypothetical protein E3N88_30938 [Mikania micrantha]|uniref:PB1 domain-containing protein n=1 Tax=Mikania micrantha TaxID=192012 RepID=A0A5N6MR03_9ASTR|nr:hypothetical protein E3N88_30938 [Mikania micrantha]